MSTQRELVANITLPQRTAIPGTELNTPDAFIVDAGASRERRRIA